MKKLFFLPHWKYRETRSMANFSRILAVALRLFGILHSDPLSKGRARCISTVVLEYVHLIQLSYFPHWLVWQVLVQVFLKGKHFKNIFLWKNIIFLIFHDLSVYEKKNWKFQKKICKCNFFSCEYDIFSKKYFFSKNIVSLIFYDISFYELKLQKFQK